MAFVLIPSMRADPLLPKPLSLRHVPPVVHFSRHRSSIASSRPAESIGTGFKPDLDDHRKIWLPAILKTRDLASVQVTLRRNSMPPMVTRSRAKAKNSTEPQPPVLAKRSRKDTSPMLEQVHSEDDVLNAGCASRNGSLENIQKENCKPSHVNIGIPKNIGILNVELNELYQENETIAELERFDGQETFSINNAIELLNTNYDNWKSHFTGTSSDDDSIKAFISYENLHYPDNLADLANKCGVDVVTLTNAFENGLDITHENITHVSNSSDENSVHSDQTNGTKIFEIGPHAAEIFSLRAFLGI